MGVRIVQKRINSKKYEYTCAWRVYAHQKIVASGQQSGFTTREAAKAWGDTEYAKHAPIKTTGKYTVGKLLDEIVESRKDKLAPSTYNGYKVNIEHMRDHIGDIEPVNLDYMAIQKMADALRASKLKEKTVRYVIRTLHALLQIAVVKMKIMPFNPCIGIEIAEDDAPFQATLYSAELLDKLLVLLREQEHELYAPVLCAASRGLRRGEVLALEWSMIDFDASEAPVTQSYNRVKGAPATRKVKSKKSHRTISVRGTFADELKRIKELRESHGRITRWVCEYDTGARMEASHLSRYLGRFQEANGLPVCRFHDLRHTCAKLNIEAGTGLETLSKLLGHSKISITSDIYLQENITMFHKASDALEEKIFSFAKKVKEVKNDEAK